MLHSIVIGNRQMRHTWVARKEQVGYSWRKLSFRHAERADTGTRTTMAQTMTDAHFAYDDGVA
jgi:hypothetical protein